MSHTNTEIQLYHICPASHHRTHDRRKGPEMGILGNLSRGIVHLRTTPFFIWTKWHKRKKRVKAYTNGYKYSCTVIAVSLRELNYGHCLEEILNIV